MEGLATESHCLAVPLQRWETTHVIFCFQNTVGVGRYDVTKGERCPQQLRYQSLYLHDAQRYLSNPKQDAYLL